MNQLVIFSCLLVVSMVAGAPSRAHVRKLVDDKPFQVEDTLSILRMLENAQNRAGTSEDRESVSILSSIIGAASTFVVFTYSFSIDCEDVYGDSSEATCRALFPRYYWSVAKKDCVEDTSGCANTKNNFRTKDDCLKVAKPICLTN